MAKCILSHERSHFNSINSQDALCGVCRELWQHNKPCESLSLDHNTEYEAFITRWTEEQSTASGAKARAKKKTDVTGGAIRQYPGTEGKKSQT